VTKVVETAMNIDLTMGLHQNFAISELIEKSNDTSSFTFVATFKQVSMLNATPSGLLSPSQELNKKTG
jgi:hypothetical protein